MSILLLRHFNPDTIDDFFGLFTKFAVNENV